MAFWQQRVCLSVEAHSHDICDFPSGMCPCKTSKSGDKAGILVACMDVGGSAMA
jgi:hypothetical protein